MKKTEISLSTDLYVKDTHIKNGSLKTGIKDYSVKQRVISSIIQDLEEIGYFGHMMPPISGHIVLLSTSDVKVMGSWVQVLFFMKRFAFEFDG